MPYSPLIQKESRGCCCLATRPQIRALLGFLICVRENAPPSHSKRTLAIPAGVRGVHGRMHGFKCYTSELKQLSAVIRGISRAFSRVENEAGERQCVRRPAGFTADGRADRISSRFDRICSFFCAYRLEKGSVSSTRIFAKSVCQPYARFRKQADFSPVCGRFPCVRCIHQKSISLQPRG